MNLAAEAVVAEVALKFHVVRAPHLLEHSYSSIVINHDKTQNSMPDRLSAVASLVAIGDGNFVSRRHVKTAKGAVVQVGRRGRISCFIWRTCEDRDGVGKEIRCGKCGLEAERSR
jgi:hypothetical protein